MVVFGQDEAISSLATSIKLARAGLKSGDKPIGSFLLAGPTGVLLLLLLLLLFYTMPIAPVGYLGGLMGYPVR